MKIMAFGAHPGDAHLGAGGTLAKHAKRGDEVLLVSLSHGELSHAPTIWERRNLTGGSPQLDKVREIKESEFKRATETIGATAKTFAFGECPLSINRDEMLTLVDVIREARPDVVLTNWMQDWLNHDHEVAGEYVSQACSYAGCQGLETRHPSYKISNIYYYTVNPISFAPEIGFTPDYYVDIEETIDLKITALCEFRTQRFTQSYITEFSRSIHYFLGYRSNTRYAEAFKRNWRPPKPYKYLR